MINLETLASEALTINRPLFSVKIPLGVLKFHQSLGTQPLVQSNKVRYVKMQIVLLFFISWNTCTTASLTLEQRVGNLEKNNVSIY